MKNRASIKKCLVRPGYPRLSFFLSTEYIFKAKVFGFTDDNLFHRLSMMEFFLYRGVVVVHMVNYCLCISLSSLIWLGRGIIILF